MNHNLKSYKDLRVWSKGIDLVTRIYRTTQKFPKTEIYSLTQQMRRCSVSIPSNIAEGFRRFHSKEYIQFLRISLGSCAELETQTIIGNNLNYISDDEQAILLEKLDHLSRMLTKLIKNIKT